jgi:hypothetical protein
VLSRAARPECLWVQAHAPAQCEGKGQAHCPAPLTCEGQGWRRRCHCLLLLQGRRLPHGGRLGDGCGLHWRAWLTHCAAGAAVVVAAHGPRRTLPAIAGGL